MLCFCLGPCLDALTIRGVILSASLIAQDGTTEAALCDLATRISASISALRANAIAARLQLSAFPGDEGSHLVADVDRIESIKLTALESELVLVDKILEDFQSITTASCLDALEALSPHTTSESLSAILSHLERLSIDLQCLPRVPVEPCSLMIAMDAGKARVVAPRALLAANFSIRPGP